MYVQWLTDFAQAVSQPSPALLHHCLCQNPNLFPAVLNIHVGKQKIIMPHVHVHVVPGHLTVSGLSVSVTLTHSPWTSSLPSATGTSTHAHTCTYTHHANSVLYCVNRKKEKEQSSHRQRKHDMHTCMSCFLKVKLFSDLFWEFLLFSLQTGVSHSSLLLLPLLPLLPPLHYPSHPPVALYENQSIIKSLAVFYYSTE